MENWRDGGVEGWMGGGRLDFVGDVRDIPVILKYVAS